jgi:hypothetical protein
MGKRWLQAPPRKLLHGAQSLDLPSNVKMGHRANKLPRWSQTPPPWFQFPPFPSICRCWSPTLSAQQAKMQGVPNYWCLQARCALPTLQVEERRSDGTCGTRQTLLHSPCRTLIFPVMVGASLELRNSGPLHIRMKTRAQHAAAALSGSRGSSSLKCVAVSPLQYTTSHIPPQVQDALLLLSLSLSLDPQDSVTLASVHSSAKPQTANHIPVPPEEGSKAPTPVNNPCVDPPVCQLVVVNKAANTIHLQRIALPRIVMGGIQCLMEIVMTLSPTKIWTCQTTPTVRLLATPGG